MKNKKIKVPVLKRRFIEQKKNNPEKINIYNTFKSTYGHLMTGKYLDSIEFAVYEAAFPENAREFYIKSGADRYNHDALYLDVDAHTLEEHKHIDEQFESKLALIDDFNIGNEVEKVAIDTRLEQVTKRQEELIAERDRLTAIYNFFNRKVG